MTCVGVRAPFPFDGSSMISWYQSYERKLKLGLGGGRSGKESWRALPSKLATVSTTGLNGSRPPFGPRSDNGTTLLSCSFFGYCPSSYSELWDPGAGALEIAMGGGALATGGTYSSNLYRGARSRGVAPPRGVSLPRIGLTACIMSSSMIMLLLILTLSA